MNDICLSCIEHVFPQITPVNFLFYQVVLEKFVTINKGIAIMLEMIGDINRVEASYTRAGT